MVRFPDTSGVDAHDAVRRARGLHPVELDKPRDKGAELKKAQPNLGWLPDSDAGNPVLPWSVFARLIHRAAIVANGLGASFRAHYLSEAALERVWQLVLPTVDMGAMSITD